MSPSKNEPRHHTRQVRERWSDLSSHHREDVTKVDDPQVKALFETTAEVLDGLNRAFQHYEEHSEEACWKVQPERP